MAGQPLEGRVAAVTGASSGIGAATATALSAAGATVALAARRRDRLEQLAESLEGPVSVHEVDITDEAQARAFVEAAHSEHGGLHALVNNAGLMLLGPAAEADTSQWRQMIDVNLWGLLICTHAALPLIAGIFVIEVLTWIIQIVSFKRTGRRVFLIVPIHHHFEMKAWSETKIMVRFWIICAIFCASGFALFYRDFLQFALP